MARTHPLLEAVHLSRPAGRAAVSGRSRELLAPSIYNSAFSLSATIIANHYHAAGY